MLLIVKLLIGLTVIDIFMGKKLIIKGADFSVNGIPSPVDITGRFSWEDGGGISIQTGNINPSQAFKCTPQGEGVDISNYIGRTIKITIPRYNTTSGAQALFGHVILNSEGDIVRALQFPLYSEDPSVTSQGDVIVVSAVIPDTAKFMKATFFKDESEWITQPFKCEIW